VSRLISTVLFRICEATPPPLISVELYHRLWSLLEDTELELFVVAPLGGPPPTLSSAHTLGLTVFPEVPCCQVTLCPSATTDRAFPCTNAQRAHNTGPFCYRTCARKVGYIKTWIKGGRCYKSNKYILILFK